MESKPVDFNDEEKDEIYYEKMKFLIVDCRLDTLQKEALLPNSFQLDIKKDCNKELLQLEVDKLSFCKDIYHICLVGLGEFAKAPQIVQIEEESNESNLDIEDFHERILKYLVEEFVRRGFKFVTHFQGGFEQCHRVALHHRIQLVVHLDPCYHCLKDDSSEKAKFKQQSIYSDEYNLTGFKDIFSGFKVLYDMASQIKSFVKTPIKFLGNTVPPEQQTIERSTIGGTQIHPNQLLQADERLSQLRNTQP